MTPVLKIADFGFARSLQPQVSGAAGPWGMARVLGVSSSSDDLSLMTHH